MPALSTARFRAARELEVFIWEGPEREVDAQIRRASPLRAGWWFRSYRHSDILGWVQLYRVRP